MIKLMKAIAAEVGKELAKAEFLLRHSHCPDTHTLILHQDLDGVWHPELKIRLTACANKDLQQVRVLISATLGELQEIISSEEAGCLKTTTDMLDGGIK